MKPLLTVKTLVAVAMRKEEDCMARIGDAILQRSGNSPSPVLPGIVNSQDVRGEEVGEGGTSEGSDINASKEPLLLYLSSPPSMPPPSPHSRNQQPNPMCNARLWDLLPARVLSGIKSNPSLLFNRRAWNLWLFATDRLENKLLSEL